MHFMKRLLVRNPAKKKLPQSYRKQMQTKNQTQHGRPILEETTHLLSNCFTVS